MGKWIFLGAIGLMCAGCSRTLETGYEPMALNMSNAQQKAMYSDPYSDKAEAARQERTNTMNARKPTAY